MFRVIFLKTPLFRQQESSLASMQPELSATFLKTTAAKRIPTNAFQVRKVRPFYKRKCLYFQMSSS